MLANQKPEDEQKWYIYRKWTSNTNKGRVQQEAQLLLNIKLEYKVVKMQENAI